MAAGVTVRELFATLGLDVDERGFARGNSLISGISKGLAVAVAGASTLAIGMVALGKSTADAGIDAFKAAKSLGITTDAVQELDNVADEALISSEELQQSLKFLARNAAEAANGGGEAAKVFRALGIQLDPNNLPPVDQLLETVADRFNAVVPEAQKTSVAMKLFGRSGAGMIGTLSLGSERIRELREEAHELGIVLDGSAIEASLEFGRAVRQLEDNLKGLKFALGVPIVKVLNAVLGKLLELGKVVRAFFRGEFPKAMAAFRVALIAAALGLAAFAAANAAAVFGVVSSWTMMAAAAVAKSAIIAASWIAAHAVLIPLVAAVLMAAVVLEDLYSFMVGKRSVIGDAIRDIKHLADEYRTLADALEDVGTWLGFSFGRLTMGGDFRAEENKNRFEEERIMRAALAGGPASMDAAAASTTSVTRSMTLPSIAVTVNAAPGMDESQLAKRTAEEVAQQLGSAARAAKAAIP